jgi:hypothetical protein
LHSGARSALHAPRPPRFPGKRAGSLEVGVGCGKIVIGGQRLCDEPI